VTLKVMLCECELFSPSTTLLAEHSTVRVRPTQSGWTTSERQPAPNLVSLSRVAGLRLTSGPGFPRAVQRSSSPTDKDDVFGVNLTSLEPSTRTKQQSINQSINQSVNFYSGLSDRSHFEDLSAEEQLKGKTGVGATEEVLFYSASA